MTLDPTAFNEALSNFRADTSFGLEEKVGAAITAYLSSLSERGVRLMPREPTEAMRAAVAPRPAHWPPAGADRNCDAAIMADQTVAAMKWTAMFDAQPKDQQP